MFCTTLQTEAGGGVYGEDENRFVFNNVLVGMRATARFKISNPNKVRPGSRSPTPTR